MTCLSLSLYFFSPFLKKKLNKNECFFFFPKKNFKKRENIWAPNWGGKVAVTATPPLSSLTILDLYTIKNKTLNLFFLLYYIKQEGNILFTSFVFFPPPIKIYISFPNQSFKFSLYFIPYLYHKSICITRLMKSSPLVRNNGSYLGLFMQGQLNANWVVAWGNRASWKKKNDQFDFWVLDRSTEPNELY